MTPEPLAVLAAAAASNLATGEHDSLSRAWPGEHLLETGPQIVPILDRDIAVRQRIPQASPVLQVVVDGLGVSAAAGHAGALDLEALLSLGKGPYLEFLAPNPNAAARLHCALWMNCCYRFATWRWGRVVAALLVMGWGLKLSLPM